MRKLTFDEKFAIHLSIIVMATIYLITTAMFMGVASIKGSWTLHSDFFTIFEAFVLIPSIIATLILSTRSIYCHAVKPQTEICD